MVPLQQVPGSYLTMEIVYENAFNAFKTINEEEIIYFEPCKA